MIEVEDIRLTDRNTLIKENQSIVTDALVSEYFEDNLTASENVEDDDIFINRSKSRKKVILSDDEDEVNNEQNNYVPSNKKLLSSEEESENDELEPMGEKISLSQKNLISSRHRLLQVQDSDDGSASDDMQTSLTFSKNTSKKDDHNSKLEVNDEIPGISKYEYNSGIFDTETSDDELGHNHPHSPVKSDRENSNDSLTLKQKKKSLKKKSKAVTIIEQKNEKLKIFSESQKRIRESEIYLPYHKPKQRSLNEFLNRKKSVFSTPSNMRRSLKMSMRDENLLREIEERKKEVATFYKSDSEEEEDGRDESVLEMDDKRDQIMDSEEKGDILLGMAKKGPQIHDHVQKVHSWLEMEGEREASHGNRNDKMDSGMSKEENKVNSQIEDGTEKNDFNLELKELASDHVKDIEENGDSQLPSELKIVQENINIVNKENIIDEVAAISNKCNNAIDLENNLIKDKVVIVREVQDSLQGHFNVDSHSLNGNESVSERNVMESSLSVNDSNKDIDILNEKEMPDFADCLKDSAIKEIFSNSNDDTENFRLHLDSDDILGDSSVPIDNSLNMSLELRKAISISNRADNVITPKMQSLAARYPKLDLSKIPTLTHKISNDSDSEFIDLSDEETGCETPKLAEGAFQLINRFVQHSNTKKKAVEAKTVSLNIVSKEKNTVGEEKLVSSDIIVDINPDAAPDDNYKEPVPGARLVLLKNSLKAKLLQQREKDRQRREKEKKFIDSEEVIEDYNDGLPDEGEFNDGSESEYETESEPEEEDVVIKDKKRKKNKFLDEEAQESDEDAESEKEIEDEETESKNSRIGLNDESEDSKLYKGSKKSTRKIDNDEDDDFSNVNVNYEVEDSDDDEPQLKLQWSESINIDTRTTQALNKISRTSTEDLFSSQIEENIGKKDPMDASFELVGSVIPGHQPGGGTSGRNKSDSFVEDDTSALSLFSRLDNFRKSCSSDDNESHKQKTSLNLLLTPLKSSQITPSVVSPSRKALLVMDQHNSEDSLEMLGLCSGQFTTQVPEESNVKKVSDLCDDDDNDEYPPTQDIDNLVGLCSGQFNTQKHPGSLSEETNVNRISDLCKEDEYPLTQDITDLAGLCSGKFTTQKSLQLSQGFSLGESEKAGGSHLNGLLQKLSSLKNQQRCLNPTGSPLKLETECNLQSPIEETTKALVNKSNVEIYSSDEDGILQRQQKKKKRKRKRIVAMSDDEGEASNDSLASITDEDVEYDEDELPLVKEKFSGFQDRVSGGLRRDFLDKEAELSGSEVGSEDEEEPDEDNDVMEQEEGDLDRFDQDQLRDEIGKAHLKSMIESDKREVRLLQELYLEDGDLHGQGRQRKFRWRHLDSTDDNEGRKSDEDELENEETLEEESEWRKERFEREKFIRDQKSSNSIVTTSADVVENTTEPALEPSRKLKRTLSNRPNSVSSSKSFPIPSMSQSVLSLSSASKRGSFLQRDSSTLKKLAEFTKENQTVGGAKQGGNFVFTTLTAEEIEKTRDMEKRKQNFEKPQPKKCRLERSFFSMDAGSQNLSIFKHL